MEAATVRAVGGIPFSGRAPWDGAVDVGVTPVWRLDFSLVAAYAIRRRLPAPLSDFTAADHEAVDAAVAEFLTPLLRDYRREGGRFAILCPFTISTLSARRSRVSLMQRCAEVADIMKQAVVLEVDGVTRGAPSGRIRETLAMCRPMARFLTLSVTDVSALPLDLDLGSAGVALDAAVLKNGRLEAAVAVARRRTANVVVHSAPRSLDLDLLGRLGASHVTPDRWAPENAAGRFAA